MKFIRIALYSLGGLILLLLILMLILPYFFKNDIKKAIDAEIAKNINADVFYNADKFSLTFFAHFPHLSVGLQDFGIVNKAPFAGDTLVSVQNFELSLNLWKAVFGGETQVNGIYLDKPRIFGRVLSDGKANWDIVKTDTTQKKEEPKKDEKPTKFQASIQYWKIKKGLIVYNDKVSQTFISLQNLNHSGSGNFNQDEFDLNIRTQINKLTADYEGVNYLKEKSIQLDATLAINLPKNTYTFKDNTLKINDFSVGLEGFVQMQKTDIITDLKFAVKETQFKNILSLVPGIYTQSFKDLKTSGSIACEGFAKGTFNETKLPTFGLKLLVKDGFLQYPQLPMAVKNVQIDLNVKNTDGVMMNTSLELNKMQANVGNNPFNAKAIIKGLSPATIEANINTKLNLAELSQIFPIEGLTMKGLFGLNLQAKGFYNGAHLPQIQAAMDLQQGYIKSKYFPEPLEQITLKANAVNNSGKYEDTEIGVQNFMMVLANEPFTASAVFSNLADVNYKIKAKGSIMLEKITKIYPLEGMQLKGKVYADINTQGKISDATAGKYDKLPTQGYTELTNFLYTSASLPQGFGIKEAKADFTPEKIILQNFDGNIGKNPLKLTGTLSNYITYILSNGILKGEMKLESNLFDANEFIPQAPDKPANKTTEAPKPQTQVASQTSNTGVVEVPKNIDFNFLANIKQVIYGKITLNNATGKIIVKDGFVRLEDMRFNALGGNFNAKGLYDTREMLHPKFAFNFGIDKLPLQEVFMASVDSKTNRIAQDVQGDVSTTFDIVGELTQEMMPRLDKTLSGNGSVVLLSTLITGVPALQNIAKLTGIKEFEEVNVRDTKMFMQIIDGQVVYKPFDVQTGDYKVNISGNNGLDGSLNFLLKLDIPTTNLKPIARTTLAALTGKLGTNTEKINLDLKLTGFYNQPKVALAQSSAKEMVKQAIKEKVKETLKENKEVQKVRENVTQKTEEIMQQARQQAASIKQEARNLADKIKQEADANAQKGIDEASKNGFIAKLAAERIIQRAKREAYKKADQIVEEADKKADAILQKAQEQTDKIKNEVKE